MARVKIHIPDILELLSTGVTKKTKDKNYNPSIGSLQTAYGLSTAEIDRLFRHPDLRGKNVTPHVEEAFEISEESDLQAKKKSAVRKTPEKTADEIIETIEQSKSEAPEEETEGTQPEPQEESVTQAPSTVVEPW